MAQQKTQSFENHVRHDPMVYIALGACLVTLAVAGAAVYFDNARLAGAAVIVAVFAIVVVAAMARGYGVKLQDRIIRAEMRLRLERVLPDNLQPRILDFALAQLVALRFASDTELPDLARRALDENLSATDIKKAVKDWQADWHRV